MGFDLLSRAHFIDMWLSGKLIYHVGCQFQSPGHKSSHLWQIIVSNRHGVMSHQKIILEQYLAIILQCKIITSFYTFPCNVDQSIFYMIKYLVIDISSWSIYKRTSPSF
eukprot:NODE_490_length_6857_cov_0.383249.p10 type:complete len:109 gc:universal NODE_490_length_6857_cov_0.383249:6325-5999(-)